MDNGAKRRTVDDLIRGGSTVDTAEADREILRAAREGLKEISEKLDDSMIEALEKISRAVRELEETRREAVKLAFGQDIAVTDMASACQVSRQTIYNWLGMPNPERSTPEPGASQR